MKSILKTLLLVLGLCCAGQLSAQLIIVKTATRQHYAAGMCCAQGINYAIALRVTKPNVAFVIDSLWIEGRGFAKPNVEDGTLTITKDTAGTSYVIQEWLRWGLPYSPDEPPMRYPLEGSTRQGSTPVTVFYRSNGIPHRLNVGELVELFPLAYP